MIALLGQQVMLEVEVEVEVIGLRSSYGQMRGS